MVWNARAHCDFCRLICNDGDGVVFTHVEKIEHYHNRSEDDCLSQHISVLTEKSERLSIAAPSR
jgi:hypothetical protein